MWRLSDPILTVSSSQRTPDPGSILANVQDVGPGLNQGLAVISSQFDFYVFVLARSAITEWQWHNLAAINCGRVMVSMLYLEKGGHINLSLIRGQTQSAKWYINNRMHYETS